MPQQHIDKDIIINPESEIEDSYGNKFHCEFSWKANAILQIDFEGDYPSIYKCTIIDQYVSSSSEDVVKFNKVMKELGFDQTYAVKVSDCLEIVKGIR